MLRSRNFIANRDVDGFIPVDPSCGITLRYIYIIDRTKMRLNVPFYSSSIRPLDHLLRVSWPTESNLSFDKYFRCPSYAVLRGISGALYSLI